MAFSVFGLAPAILQALLEEGYEKPTPIQAQAIGPIMQGRDVLGCAQTGTGKTAAFALPILHRLNVAGRDLARRGPNPPRVLVLAPTRELANQIGDSFATYGRHTGLVHTCIYGGVSQFHQVKALRRGVDVLVATPGRLMDLMQQRAVDLSAVGIFVLDEADRMLDMGFIQPIRRIAAALPTATPRQTLLFSATMPREIAHLAESLLRDPVRIAVTPVASTAPLIEQSLYFVPKPQKTALLRTLLESEGVSRAVVFSRTKHGADKLCKSLVTVGISAVAIHGNKAQNQRDRALEAFRSGRARLLVATDVAARGLDVDGITHVINYDLPIEPEAYVHRIGRTGRAGATGKAISFCDREERDQLRRIERLTGKRINTIPLPELKPDTHQLPAALPGQHTAGHGGRHADHHRSAEPHQQPSDRGPRPGPGWDSPRHARDTRPAPHQPQAGADPFGQHQPARDTRAQQPRNARAAHGGHGHSRGASPAPHADHRQTQRGEGHAKHSPKHAPRHESRQSTGHSGGHSAGHSGGHSGGPARGHGADRSAGHPHAPRGHGYASKGKGKPRRGQGR